MSTRELWTKRLAAIAGCLFLLLCTFAGVRLILVRSWHDLEDANVRMHIFRFHVFDPDFIWSAIAFAAVVLTIAGMVLCCLWALWMLVSHWDMAGGNDRRDPGASSKR